MDAVVRGNLDVIRLLLQAAGAQLNIKDNKGKTALDIATELSPRGAVELLGNAMS